MSRDSRSGVPPVGGPGGMPWDHGPNFNPAWGQQFVYGQNGAVIGTPGQVPGGPVIPGSWRPQGQFSRWPLGYVPYRYGTQGGQPFPPFANVHGGAYPFVSGNGFSGGDFQQQIAQCVGAGINGGDGRNEGNGGDWFQNHGGAETKKVGHWTEKPKEFICPHCGEGHRLRYCNRPPNGHGFMNGCGKCDSKYHVYEQCPVQDGKANDEIHINIDCRNNLPPLRTTQDFRLIPGFNLTGNRPLTPSYVKVLAGVGYFDQFIGKIILKDEHQYPRDPAWNDEDALKAKVPLGEMVDPWWKEALRREDEAAEVRLRLQKQRLQPRMQQVGQVKAEEESRVSASTASGFTVPTTIGYCGNSRPVPTKAPRSPSAFISSKVLRERAKRNQKAKSQNEKGKIESGKGGQQQHDKLAPSGVQQTNKSDQSTPDLSRLPATPISSQISQIGEKRKRDGRVDTMEKERPTKKACPPPHAPRGPRFGVANIQLPPRHHQPATPGGMLDFQSPTKPQDSMGGIIFTNPDGGKPVKRCKYGLACKYRQTCTQAHF
ncbi:hypothetical protein BJ875DRAFT_530558 [Amylocarpus encephaloides]|uniref:Uncharacterized protein n=1 Tax=Amylocarpus encephaloides TaxID=45428 RepID=A0A9P7YKY0_9HELO|nr:hypothetical protein BJ875DRAFT_530558 [Amylocarpus encephaloides]